MCRPSVLLGRQQTYEHSAHNHEVGLGYFSRGQCREMMSNLIIRVANELDEGVRSV